jgi:hypothetical protein
MIYCVLKGGLANMMFQIAATYSFSIDYNTDCSFPNLDHMFNYLNSEKTFNPNLSHAEEYNLIFKKLKKVSPFQNLRMIYFPFEYTNLRLPYNEDVIINGFFQSEKYFKHNREKILELFEPDNLIKEIIEQKYENLLTKKTTAIHVRRGDYLKFPHLHPFQGYDYYSNAINELKSDTETFLIFSDDIEWCKNNFEGDEYYFVENEKDYVELYLMSMCKNNIISNSSFSWWGAWMNKNYNKKVIGPKNWFGSSMTLKADDIIPLEWIKL